MEIQRHFDQSVGKGHFGWWEKSISMSRCTPMGTNWQENRDKEFTQKTLTPPPSSSSSSASSSPSTSPPAVLTRSILPPPPPPPPVQRREARVKPMKIQRNFDTNKIGKVSCGPQKQTEGTQTPAALVIPATGRHVVNQRDVKSEKFYNGKNGKKIIRMEIHETTSIWSENDQNLPVTTKDDKKKPMILSRSPPRSNVQSPVSTSSQSSPPPSKSPESKSTSMSAADSERSQSKSPPRSRSPDPSKPRPTITTTPPPQLNQTEGQTAGQGQDVRGPTMREILLDRAFNVPTLLIGDDQKIQLERTDRLFLPALKTFSWHALKLGGSGGDSIRKDDENEDDSLSEEFAGGKNEEIRKWQQESGQKKRQAVYKILRSSPNLELIKDFRFDTDFDLVLASSKVHCIQHLVLFDTVNVDHLLDFIEARPKVQILQLIDTYMPTESEDPFNNHGDLNFDTEERRRRLALAIHDLLVSTAKTLRVLDLSQFCSRVTDIQIPSKMSNLRQLTFGSAIGHGDPYGTWKPEPSRVLPERLVLDKTFKNLFVLDLSRIQCGESSNWNLYFPPTNEFQGCLETVKILVLNDQCTHTFMEKVRTKLCPNFIKLVVHSWGGRDGGCGLNFMLIKIFKFWQHLQHLELRISDLSASSSAAFCLDAPFTGFTVETCRRLRVFGPAAEPDDEIVISMALVGRNAHVEKSQGPRPSISNLKDLKTLEIILGHNCLGKLARYDEDENNPMPLFSFVSGRYGFGHLLGLRAVVIFDQKCPWGNAILKKKFNYLSPYITLRHKRDDECSRLGQHQHLEQKSSTTTTTTATMNKNDEVTTTRVTRC